MRNQTGHLGTTATAGTWFDIGYHGAVTVNSRSGNFTAGYHSIEVDYCNVQGYAALTLSWKGPNDTSYSVSTVALHHIMICI